MKAAHLLRVEGEPALFQPLIHAAGEAGLRIGWLEWRQEADGPDSVPELLAEAASAGVLRAVRVDAAGAVVVKPRRGPAVLRDVLREHFAGCRAVLIRGELQPLPRLDPNADGWKIDRGALPPLTLSTQELVARLRSPKPIAPAEGAREGEA